MGSHSYWNFDPVFKQTTRGENKHKVSINLCKLHVKTQYELIGQEDQVGKFSLDISTGKSKQYEHMAFRMYRMFTQADKGVKFDYLESCQIQSYKKYFQMF